MSISYALITTSPNLDILNDFKGIQYNLDIISLILDILHIIQSRTRNTMNTAEYIRLVKEHKKSPCETTYFNKIWTGALNLGG